MANPTENSFAVAPAGKRNHARDAVRPKQDHEYAPRSGVQQSLAKRFLLGENIQLTDAVLSGLHQALPGRAGQIIAARKAGAALGRNIVGAEHMSVQELVNHPEFEMKPSAVKPTVVGLAKQTALDPMLLPRNPSRLRAGSAKVSGVRGENTIPSPSLEETMGFAPTFRHVSSKDDIVRSPGFANHHEHSAPDEHMLGTAGRVKDKGYPQFLDSVDHAFDPDKLIQLEPNTAAAYEQLLAHARAAGFSAPLFSIVSAFRTDENQGDLYKKSEKDHGCEDARTWVAKPGGSAHRTGRAIDFWLGRANGSANVDQLRQTEAWKWLRANAAKFGFAPYPIEPWHWEYNPQQMTSGQP